MGDRGNIAVEFEDGTRVYFYTHWGGSHVRQTLARALASPEGQSRLGDEAYLSRIIFQRLLEEGGGLGEDRELGFGISTFVPDNEYPIPVVRPAEGVVTIEGDPHGYVSGEPGRFTVNQFISLYLEEE